MSDGKTTAEAFANVGYGGGSGFSLSAANTGEFRKCGGGSEWGEYGTFF